MSRNTIADNGDGTVNITLNVDGSMADVMSACEVIASKTGYASVDPNTVSVVDYVGQQTRLWWGSFLKDFYLAQIEAAAQAAAETARQAGLEQMAANPLFSPSNQ